MAILARLLVPEDFGLMTFGLLIIAYIETVGDFGISMALIYWPSRRNEAAQVTFIMNLIMGLVWLPFSWSLAPLVGQFFQNSSAVPILRALAFHFPIKALGNTHDALLRKDLKFRERLIPDIGMAMTKALIAVILAKLGFGVFSLVWGQLLGEGICTILTWIIVDWRPGLTMPLDLVRPMIAYGRYIVGVNILAAIVHHMDFVVVGKMLGAATLGFYQIAYKLPETTIVMIIRTTGKVLFPAYSKLKQGKSELRKGFTVTLRYVSILSVPIAIGFFLFAEPLVLTVFGQTWRESIPILRALGLAACFRSLGSHAGDIYKATGRTGLMMVLGVVKAIILIPALILAGRFGPAEVASALAMVLILTCTMNIGVVCHIIGIPVLSVLDALRPSVICSTIMTVSLLIYLKIFPGTLGLPGLIGGVGTGMVVYLIALVFLAPDILPEAMGSLMGSEGTESRAVQGADPGSRLLMGEVDRFLVPVKDRQMVTFFLSHLFHPHNRREQVWRSLFGGMIRLRGEKHLFPFCWSLDLPSSRLMDAGKPDSGENSPFGRSPDFPFTGRESGTAPVVKKCIGSQAAPIVKKCLSHGILSPLHLGRTNIEAKTAPVVKECIGSQAAPVVKKPVPEDFTSKNRMHHPAHMTSLPSMPSLKSMKSMDSMNSLISMIAMIADVRKKGLSLRFENHPLKDLEPFRWIALADYRGISRNRTILFLFPEGSGKPAAVLKLRPVEASGRELAAERDALNNMGTCLSHDLKTCLPSLLGYGLYGDTEALLMSWRPGHSMEHQLAGRPARTGYIRRHFQNAARWLALFHRDTGKKGRFFEPDCPDPAACAEELPEVGLKEDTVRSLADTIHTLCARGKVPLVASHGDFWARNLLIRETDGKTHGDGKMHGSGLSGVVDWEGFSEEASPFEDLFHFPLTYGFNYHWSAYHRRSPEEAFQLSFLQDTPVSRAVRQYFISYCEQAGFSLEMIEPFFRFFLLERWLQGKRKSCETKTQSDHGALWIRLYQMLDKADQSVFCG
ncbi:MAG: oligosaccharide flippase family protein, partial [bacterium]